MACTERYSSEGASGMSSGATCVVQSVSAVSASPAAATPVTSTELSLRTRSGSGPLPCPDPHLWLEVMARANKAVDDVRSLRSMTGLNRYQSGLSDRGSFMGLPVHVPTFLRDLHRRQAWHQEWVDYGQSLRWRLPPR